MAKAKREDFNFIEHFRSVVGSYSMTAIKGDRLEWTCSIYRGGKRIGTAQRVNTSLVNDAPGAFTVEYSIADSKEQTALFEYVDKAGPYGFLSIEDFLGDVLDAVFLLKEMRDSAKKGYLVVVDKLRIDDNGLPKSYKTSSKKANEAWLKNYQKQYPAMQVMNFQLQ